MPRVEKGAEAIRADDHDQPIHTESTQVLTSCLQGPHCKRFEHKALRNMNSLAELDLGPMPKLVYILVSLVLAVEPWDP